MSLRVALARNPVLTASTAVAVAAAVCFGTLGLAAPSNAVVSLDGEGVTVCAPLHDDGRVAIGISSLQNTSDATVLITGADLMTTDGIELVGLGLVDSPEAGGVGFRVDDLGAASFEWPMPIRAGETAVVVAGLAGTGRTEGVRLSYGLPGRLGEATVETRVAMETAAAGETCFD